MESLRHVKTTPVETLEHDDSQGTSAQGRPRCGCLLERDDEQHAPQAERALLGGLILQPEALSTVTVMLQPEHFHGEAHATVYRALLQLRDQGSAIDSVTVRERLAHTRRLQAIGGDDFLLSLTDTIPLLSNMLAYAALIRESALRRRLRDTCARVAHHQDGDSLEALFRFTARALAELRQEAGLLAFTKPAHLVPVAQKVTRSRGPERRFDYADETLQAATGGGREGQLILILGKPKIGKTDFALALALQHARRIARVPGPQAQDARRRLIVVITIRESQPQIGSRLARAHDATPASRAEFEALPLLVAGKPGLGLQAAARSLYRLSANEDIELVVLDGLEGWLGRKDGTRRTDVLRELKSLSEGLRASLVATVDEQCTDFDVHDPLEHAGPDFVLRASRHLGQLQLQPASRQGVASRRCLANDCAQRWP